MKIASYNIRKAVGLNWRRDAHRIVDVIGESEAEIIVLQEMDKVIAPGASFCASREIAALVHFILCCSIKATGSFVHRSITARRASDNLQIVPDFEILKDIV